ncbi:hypothetical protein B484DRAFT_394248 [Ochromonadaceae sp. CCMP2298]|nr:hypothetical protein B484DRAFT_394248 [Ochromonadaceae sp. CCMP2298]
MAAAAPHTGHGPALGDLIENPEEQQGDEDPADPTGTFGSAAHREPLFVVEDLERIEEGTALVPFLKAVPKGRTNEHLGYLCNRILKVLKTHGLIPEAAPPTFGALNASGQRTFWKVIGEQRKVDTPLIWAEIVEAAINRLPTAVEAASADTGSVVVNRYALLLHLFIDARAHPTWVRFHTKVPAAVRSQVLTEGVSQTRGAVLEELMAWARVVAAEVTNLLKVDHPQLSTIHPELGVFNTTLELDEMITATKSKFDILFYRLHKSGRQESGEILDATALTFCKTGRTLNTALFYQWVLWKDENLSFLSNALPPGVGLESGFACPWIDATPRPAGSSAVPAGPGQPGVTSARAAKELAAEKAAAVHTEKVPGAISAAIDSASKRAMLSPDSKERKKKREEAATNASEAQAAFLQQSTRIADKAQQINELRATIFHVSFNALPEEFKKSLLDRLEVLLVG